MNAALLPFILIALLLVAGTLFAGLFTMTRDGEAARRRSNKLMRLRVVLQFVAFVLIVIAMLAG